MTFKKEIDTNPHYPFKPEDFGFIEETFAGTTYYVLNSCGFNWRLETNPDRNLWKLFQLWDKHELEVWSPCKIPTRGDAVVLFRCFGVVL